MAILDLMLGCISVLMVSSKVHMCEIRLLLTVVFQPPNPSLLLSCFFMLWLMIVLLFLGDDAREAVKHGLDGILVSNHGARQLDGVPATVSCSPRQDFSLEFLFPSQI